ERRHPYRGGDPQRAARRDAAAHLAARVPPGEHGARGRSHRRARGRGGGRARHARGPARSGWALRSAPSPAAAGGGNRGIVSTFDDEAEGRAYDHRLMRRLMTYLRPYRGEVVAAVIVVIFDALAQLAGPWLTMEAIDHGIVRGDLVHLDRVAVLYLC